MRILSDILDIVMELPKKAMAGFKTMIKHRDVEKIDESTPAGVAFVTMELLEKLGVPKIIDDVLGEEHTCLALLKENLNCDEKKRTIPSVGIILSILIADMISKPREVTRIYKIQEIAEKWHLFSLFGIEPSKLNDDKILRSLSKLGIDGRNINEILMLLTLKLSEEYKIPLERILLDSTVVQLDGDFEKAAKVMYGRGSNSIRQLIASLVVSSKSRIPIGGFVYPGNTSDVVTLPDAINVINNVIPKVNQTTSIEVVMDRIYITAKNVKTMRANKEIRINWVGPLKSGLSEKRFRDKVDEAYSQGLWKDLSYRSAKEISKNEKPCLKSFETSWTMLDEIKPDLKPGQLRRAKGSIEKVEEVVRCVLYKDSKRATLAKADRDRRRKKLDSNLEDLSSKLNKRKLKTLVACQDRLEKYLKEFPDLRKYLDTFFDVDEDTQLLRLSWKWLEEAYSEEEKYDGTFALLTEYRESEKCCEELIRLYRERNEIEMNFRDLKGILELERVFIQNQERIDAYIFLKVIAYYVLTFLRWYLLDECKVKTTETNIQNSLGDINIVEGEFADSGITFCDVSGDSYICSLIRLKLGLSNPSESVYGINRKNIGRFRDWVNLLSEQWLAESEDEKNTQ